MVMDYLKLHFLLFYLVSDTFNAFPQLWVLLSCMYQFLAYRPFSNDGQRFHCIWSWGGWSTHHTCEQPQVMWEMRLSKHAVLSVKSMVFWNATRQSLILIHIELFGWTWCFHLQDRRIKMGQYVPLPNCTGLQPSTGNK